MKKPLIAASCFLFIYLAMHLKNYLLVGLPLFVVKGDVFDQIFQMISFPGQIPAYILILIVFRNIHNYPMWFSESLSLICNCLFYGYVFGKVFPVIVSKIKRRKSEV